MERDTHTEITRRSWSSRLRGAFKGIALGAVLIGGGIWLLFWNEGRAVRRARALDEGAGAVVSIEAGRVDPARNGQLVHLTGQAETYDLLEDPSFGVAVTAIHLERKVEMYQWRETSSSETETQLGGGTETTTTRGYEKVWSDTPIDSGRFQEAAGHRNPDAMPYRTFRTSAQEVWVGAFSLSEGLIRSIDRWEPLRVDSLDGLEPSLRDGARLADGAIYVGRSPATPAIGDLRVTLRVVWPARVSIVARQTGDALGPYRTTTGGSVSLLVQGAVPAEEMFEAAQASNRSTTWLIRLLGLLLLAFGIRRTLKPLSVVADVVPAIGRLVASASGFVAWLLAAFVWLVVVAVAWLFYRPALAVTLLVLAGAVLVLSVLAALRSAKRSSPPQGESTA